MAPKKKTASSKPPFIVGIVLYPGFDLLDVAGMNEVWTFVDFEPDGAADQGDHGRGRQGADRARAAESETVLHLRGRSAHRSPVRARGRGHADGRHQGHDAAQVPAPQGEARALCDLGVHRRARARGRRPARRLPGDLSLVGAGLPETVSQGDGGERLSALPARPQPFHRRRHLVLDRRGALHGAAGHYRPRRRRERRRGVPAGAAWIQYNPNPPFKGGDPASVDYSVFAPVEEPGMRQFRAAVCQAVREQIGG